MARKSRRTLWLILGTLLLLIVSTVIWFAIMKKDGPINVSVAPAETRTITQTVNAIGRLQPELMVKISSEASGEIVFLGVRDGDTVKKGQLLVRIQPDIAETQLAQARAAAEASRLNITVAKADMDRAQADLNRVTELQKKNFATREEFDRVKAAYQTAAGRYAAQRADYDRAKAALQQTQASASRTVIYAPMDGVVTYLGVELGEKVVGTAQMQGTEMMRIADLSTMNAWVEVDENDVAMIKLGDTAKINVDALRDQVFRGVVYEISHSAKVSAQGTQEEVVNFEVRIRMIDKDTKMRPGMSCNVDVETATRTNVVAVPIQSLTVREIEGLETAPDVKQGIVDRRAEAKNAKTLATSKPPSIIWIAKNDVVQARAVETGISDEGYIEITKGLKAGENIVTGPYAAVSKALKPGAKIRVEDAATRKRRLEQMRQQ